MSSAEISKSGLTGARDAHGPGRASLAARLTMLFLLSGLTLLLLVSGSLYVALVHGLQSADDEALLDKVHVLHTLINTPVPDPTIIKQEIGEDANAPRRIFMRVLAADGSVLYESPSMRAQLPVDRFRGVPLLQKPNATGQTITSVAGEPFRVLATRLEERGAAADKTVVVQAAIDTSLDEELLGRYRIALAIAAGTALLLYAAASYWAIRFGLRPVHRIAREAQLVRADTLNRRIELTRLPSELLGLASTFNSMLERLDESFKKLRQFSDDLAHELRTPINRLLVANEVALRQQRTADEYREVVSANVESCAQLSQIIQTLLFLARTESPHASIKREHVDVRSELKTIAEFYEPAAAEAGLSLSVDAPEAIEAEFDRPLFQRAIANLIANAIAHTPPGGFIKIGARSNDSTVYVEVADNGHGISPDDLPRVFERFYRADQTRSNAAGNLGLGLAIVRGIAGLHGGSAHIESALGKGTIAKLELPKRGGVTAG
jgi:two-component system heavy metal sensor histidine kinase CusS